MSSPSKDQENPLRDHMVKNSHTNSWSLPKTMICFIVLVSLPYVFYSLILLYSSDTPNHEPVIRIHRQHSRNKVLVPTNVPSSDDTEDKTSLKHVVFGIGASSSTWEHRRNYIRTWWRPNVTRGHVWLDKPVKNSSIDHLLPPIKVSGDTSKFQYKNPIGTRDAIRISRIVSESFRLGLNDVRWFVMGDDDTVFFLDNLARVLSKYDHNEYYYIGYPSESHLQNLAFYYAMGFGGGGFAISYALAKALEKIQDECLHRNPSLYGSDERIFACMMELGVPLTKHPGFHQVFCFPISV